MTTPIAYSEITSAHWQPALNAPGEVVTGLRDIDQAIRIILTTPLGSDPLRPEFGSGLFNYLDWPINRITPHLVRESVDALRRWEPRITVVRVQVVLAASAAVLRVHWRIADGVPQLTEVSHVLVAA